MRNAINSLLKSNSGRVLLLSIPVYLLITIQLQWSGDGWKQIHRSDVKGYYGYLLSTVIRHDLGHELADGDYIHETPDGTLNKYFLGTSIMMAPWFALGHGAATLTEAEKDGLSKPYLVSIGLGALLYTFIGLFFFRRLLLQLKIDDSVVFWSVIGLLFATLILQYTCMQPGWTHIYSFAAIIVFYYGALQVASRNSSRWLLASAALFALIILIRPVNGLILLGLPVILGRETKGLFQNLVSSPRLLLTGALIGSMILLIQPFFWWLQTGHFIEWSYRSEGFHWTRPAFLEVFFSFRRGLFVYSPVLLLFIASLFYLFKKDRLRTLWALTYFAAVSYLICAWWIWDYGGGFGQRPYIEHYPILFVMIALGMQELLPKHRHIVFTFIAICSILTSLQWVQFQREIIQHEYMNKEKYAHVFMQFNPEYEFCLGGAEQIAPFNPKGMELILDAATTLPADGNAWELGFTQIVDIARSAPFVCEMNHDIEYSTALKMRAGSIPIGRALFLEAEVARYEPETDASHGALVVLSIEGENGEKKYYDSHRLDPIRRKKAKEWELIKMSFEIPPLEQGDILSFYVWNQQKKRFFLDDFAAKLYAVNPY